MVEEQANQTNMKQATSKSDLSVGLLSGINFDVGNGCDVFLRNVSSSSPDYTCPR
jgi:hypothetical protein